MGIGPHLAQALIRESMYRPLTGDVVLIGRQIVQFTPQAILTEIARHGIDVATIRAADLETGGPVTNNNPAFKNQKLITDAELFRLLGVPKIVALDQSDYEGAEIIHDLTTPVPAHLKECADFILDGSTLDNVFDPAMVISNFADMLRPGGRLITANVFSNHHEPYAMLPPLWFHDYFTVNAFADCKVYILVYGDDAERDADVFLIDIDALLDPNRRVGAFVTPRKMATIVLAEKGNHSTSHLRPVQQHYRSASQWQAYRENLARMKPSMRHHLIATPRQIGFDDVKTGHLFMAEDFTARDPTTEIQKSSNHAR
jgi:hypothetical protein